MDADRASRNENVVGLYNKAQDEERIHLNELNRLYNEGITQGKAEGKLEMIKNMIKNKLDSKMIIDIAGISSKEFERIKSEM